MIYQSSWLQQLALPRQSPDITPTYASEAVSGGLRADTSVHGWHRSCSNFFPLTYYKCGPNKCPWDTTSRGDICVYSDSYTHYNSEAHHTGHWSRTQDTPARHCQHSVSFMERLIRLERLTEKFSPHIHTTLEAWQKARGWSCMQVCCDRGTSK